MESKETEDAGFHWMADSSNCGLLFRGRRKTHSHCFNHEDKQVGSCDGFELFDVYQMPSMNTMNDVVAESG